MTETDTVVDVPWTPTEDSQHLATFAFGSAIHLAEHLEAAERLGLGCVVAQRPDLGEDEDHSTGAEVAPWVMSLYAHRLPVIHNLM